MWHSVLHSWCKPVWHYYNIFDRSEQEVCHFVSSTPEGIKLIYRYMPHTAYFDLEWAVCETETPPLCLCKEVTCLTVVLHDKERNLSA